MYASKTTVLSIACGRWEHGTKDPSLDMLISATRAVAILIGRMCQMDIMSLSFLPEGEDRCTTTVVYVNNGVSPAIVRRIMAPKINDNPPSYWMIQDIEEWQGSLDCKMSVRGGDETWQ